MDLIESSNLSADDEFNHWWIATRFQYVEQVLALALAREETVSVIEFGCGTVQNLRFCRECSRLRHKIDSVCGVDPGLTASVHYRWMRSGDSVGPDARKGTPRDVLLAMDVLEHIQDDTDALSQWLTYVKRGGHVLITVPAFRWLWSYHDERLGHVRRHTRSTVGRLAAKCGLERIKARYAFGFMMPPVTVVRKLLKPKHSSTDLRRHSAPVNWLLKQAGQLEAWAGGNRWLGTSVVGIFRKQ